MTLWTSCKWPIVGEVECPIKLHGVLAVSYPKPGGVGFLIRLLIWVTIVLSTHWMKEMRLPWVRPRIGNWEDKNKGQKMCGGATRKWDVSRATRNKLEITFVILWDGRNCQIFVVQWIAQQNSTSKGRVRVAKGQNTHPSICMIL